MKKQIVSFTLILHILVVTTLCFSLTPPRKTEAVGTGLAITGFVLSVIGAVDLLSNGGVRKVSGQAYDAVNETIADLMGTGIYEDSNGDYVFSGQATQAIYESLLGSQPTRVLSDFGGAASFMGALTNYNTANISAGAVNRLNDWRSLYNDYMVTAWRARPSGSSSFSNTVFVIWDLSNVAFMNLGAVDSEQCYFTFYNNAGSTVSVDYKTFYSYSNGESSVYSGTTNYFYVTRNKYNFQHSYTPDYRTDLTYYMSQNDVGNPSSWSAYAYQNLPFESFNTAGGGVLLWSNKSLILSKSTGAGLGTATQQSGIMVSNTFNTIPSVSKTVIENNDWDYIYNSYVQNVNNESSNYWDGSAFDTEKLLEYMQAYSNNINQAIQSGTDNIEQAILTSNEWLQRIYQRLSILTDILNNMGSGGGGGGSGSSWTAQDIETLLDAIDRIDSNLSLSLQDMEAIYTILGSILNALESGSSPSDPNFTLPAIDVPFEIIEDLPSTEVLESITTAQIVTGLLEDTFLFGSIFLISGVLDLLASEPEIPHFEIPIKMDTLIHIDETLDIDFTPYDEGFSTFRTIVGDLVVILFIAMLIKLTYELISFVIELVK